MAFKLNCIAGQGQPAADDGEPSGSRHRGTRSTSTSLGTSSTGGTLAMLFPFLLLYACFYLHIC